MTAHSVWNMQRYNKHRVMNIKPGSKKVKDRTKRIGDGTVVVPHKPLRGRKIFLHLLGCRGADKLEEHLKLLGADIEKCFSREVNVLITSQGVSKDYERIKTKSVSPSGTSPTTLSPFNLANLKVVDSPQPEQGGSTLNRKPLTRGQSIVLRATRNSGSGDVIENARRWKIKIIHIDDAQKYVCRELEKIQPRDHERDLQKKQDTKGSLSKPKVKRLQGHYIKFEDASHKYRPVTKCFACFPSLDTSVPPGRCLFDKPKEGCVSLPLELAAERAEHEEHDKNGDDDNNAELQELQQDPDSVGSQAEKIRVRTRHGSRVQRDVGLKADSKNGVSKNDSHENKQTYTKVELQHMLMDKMKAELKSGYCETCEVKYKDIDKHVKTERHRQFSRQPANYASLDELIQRGPNMEQLLNAVKKQQDLRKTSAKRVHSGSEDTQKSDQSCDQRDKWLRSRRSPKTWKHGAVVCLGNDNQKVASSADTPDRAGVNSDTKEARRTCPQRGLATPRLAKLKANIMLSTRSDGSWFNCPIPDPQTIIGSTRDDIVSSTDKLAGSYLGEHSGSSHALANLQCDTPEKDGCDPKPEASRDVEHSPAHSEVDASHLCTVQTPKSEGTISAPSLRVYITPLRITEKSQFVGTNVEILEAEASSSKPGRESTPKSKSILKKPGVKSPVKQVLFSKLCCHEEVCAGAELNDLEDGLKPIDWNASDASLDAAHRQDETQKTESVKQSPRKLPFKGSQRKVHAKQSPRKVTNTLKKVTDVQSPKKEHKKQSPRKMTDVQSPKKEHSKQSPRKMTDVQSPKKEHIKQSPRKMTDVQSPKKEHIKQSPRKMTDVQSPKKEHIKQSPRKVTDVQSPKRVHSKQSPRKVTDVQSPKRVHIKQSPRKVTDVQSPKREHSKQSPRKVTDVQSPKRVHSKQSPRKVTDVQSPKRVHSKQSPRKVTDVQSRKKVINEQSPRKVKGKQSRIKGQTGKETLITISNKQLLQGVTGEQLSEKAETSNQLMENVMTTEQSTRRGTHSPDKAVQKRVPSKCSCQTDFNTSSARNCKHDQRDSFSQMHCEAGVDENSDVLCIISGGLDLESENNEIQAIGEIQDEQCLSTSKEVILASDNSTDVQQTAIKLPPINILSPKQHRFVNDSNLNLFSSFCLSAVDDRSSDLSEGWDRQVESFLSQVGQSQMLTRGPAASAAVSSSCGCQPLGRLLPREDSRQPLQELEVSASGEGRDDSLIETQQNLNASDGARKRRTWSGCDPTLPLKRRFVIEPLHCSTPWKPNHANVNGSGSQAGKDLDEKLTRMDHKTCTKQTARSKSQSESKLALAGVGSGKKRSCDSADDRLIHSDGTAEPSGSKKQKISGDSFEFDYRQLTKRFGAGHHIRMIPKPGSGRKANHDSSPASPDKSPGCMSEAATTSSNPSTVPPSRNTSKGSDLPSSTSYASSLLSSSSSVLGVTACARSLSEPAPGATTAPKSVLASAGSCQAENRSADGGQKSGHVIPKITPTKKTALLAAKARGFVDDSASGSSRHRPECKRDLPTGGCVGKRESSTVKRTK